MPQLRSSLGRLNLEATTIYGVWVNTPNDTPYQQWEFQATQTNNGLFRIRSVGTGLFLTYNGQEGGPVFLTVDLPDAQSQHQLWRREQVQAFRIFTLSNPRRCLDVCNAFDIHRHVIEWHVKRGRTPNQLWSLH